MENQSSQDAFRFRRGCPWPLFRKCLGDQKKFLSSSSSANVSRADIFQNPLGHKPEEAISGVIANPSIKVITTKTLNGTSRGKSGLITFRSFLIGGFSENPPDSSNHSEVTANRDVITNRSVGGPPDRGSV